jgi:hypothetical protein
MTCYGTVRIYVPIHNLATYNQILFVMVPFVIMLPIKFLNRIALLGGFLLPSNSE